MPAQVGAGVPTIKGQRVGVVERERRRVPPLTPCVLAFSPAVGVPGGALRGHRHGRPPLGRPLPAAPGV